MNQVIVGASKSWTIWFAVALVFFGYLQIESDHIAELISPKAMGWFNIALGAIVAVLRAVTTTSLAEKGVPKDEKSSS